MIKMCYNEEIAYEKAELQEELEAGFISYDEYESEIESLEQESEAYYNDDYW